MSDRIKPIVLDSSYSRHIMSVLAMRNHWRWHHRMCFMNNMTGATSGTGIAYPSGAPEFFSEFVLIGRFLFYIEFCGPLVVVSTFFFRS